MWFTHLFSSCVACFPLSVCTGLLSNELPDIIQQKVKETYSTWTKFCTTIKGVEMAHIQDGVKKHQKEKEDRERTEAAIAGLQCMQQQQQCRPPAAPVSLMSGISQTMQSMTLRGHHNHRNTTSSTPQTTTANVNPFTNPSGGQGNLFHPALPPVTGADRNTLNHSLAVYPIQTNTAEGIMAWHN